MKKLNRRQRFISTVLATTLNTFVAFSMTAMTAVAHAQSTIGEASAASGMSAAVPVAVVGLSGATALSAATAVTVKSVEVSGRGTVVVLETLVEGAVHTVSFTVDAAAGFAMGAGTVLAAASVTGGVLLYEGVRAVALIPNEAGRQLLFHERLTM